LSTDAEKTTRTFKTAWFVKAARNALIDDAELCRAIADVRKGQADDLGGDMFKKRLDKNGSRGIILAKGRAHWVYEYLFKKRDRDNIDDKELAAFRKLAWTYEGLDDQQPEIQGTPCLMRPDFPVAPHGGHLAWRRRTPPSAATRSPFPNSG
jgi:hypothetical protein